MPSVMIAEDDLIMADILQDVLVDGGYEVCGIARTVEQAIELGKRHKPDLAVLDIRLADGGYGMEVAAGLKRQGPVGVLYASGQVGQMVLTKSDGDALLVKPYRPEDVVHALKIVEQIVSTSSAARRFPKGFSVLNGSGKSDAAAGSSDSALAQQNARLRRQQSELARFGSFALDEPDLQLILVEAARVCAACFGVSYSGIYRYRMAENDLLVEAGVGWDPGVIGHAVSRADASSPHGRVLISRTPMICNNLNDDPGFVLPRLYTRHGIVTAMDVIIDNDFQTTGLPYGVLEVASTTQRNYDHYDIDFLTGIANMIAAAVDTANRRTALQFAAVRVQELDDDRERIKRSKLASQDEQRRIVTEKTLLVQEMQHSVRNNLQLVYAMLSNQLQITTDPVATAGVTAIARRVMTLARLYDHLIQNGSSQVIDFSTYLSALCAHFEFLEGGRNPHVELRCHAQPVILDLDRLTVLGCVVSELIANAYAHAPPDERLTISMSLFPGRTGDDATLQFSVESDVVPAAANYNPHDVEFVKRLLEQAGGTAIFSSDGGLEWLLMFPTPPRPTLAVHAPEA